MTAPPGDREAVVDLLGRELIPLYLHYLDDQITRLTKLGHADLAEAFARWRAQLLA